MRNALAGFILALSTLFLPPVAAHAAQPFNTAAFQDAQKAGKTVLLHVTAPWCSTCRAQHPIVTGLEKSRPQLVVYNIDFDSSKDLLRQLKVQSQSTLIVFKGAKEVGRSIGDTKAASIDALVAKGL